jgi:dynein heavy chain 1
LEEIRNFRSQHEQLSTVISRVLRPLGGPTGFNGITDGNADPMKQVEIAYDSVKDLDCLDTTKDGNAAWEAAMQRYRDQIGRIETQLAARLRDQLGGAKNADEMFAIFQRYNALFVRPHIRSAIREYQAKLIDRVKEDIDQLRAKYADEKNESRALILSRCIDIPPLSAKIMWIKQIEAQLTMYEKRVKDVLGEGWANHLEGRDLKREVDSFRQILNTDQLFKDWCVKIQSKEITSNGRLFATEKQQIQGRVISKLKVNYTPETIVISKEVRNLKSMGFRVPFKIVNVAHQASNTYSFAISLLESMRAYDATNDIATNRSAIGLLAANYRKSVRDLLVEVG